MNPTNNQKEKTNFSLKKKIIFSSIIFFFFFGIIEAFSLVFILLYTKTCQPEDLQGQIRKHFFSKMWATSNQTITTYQSQNPKLRYVGEYVNNPKEVHIPNSILGWKPNQNVIWTGYKEISIYNEQGFSSIGEALFVYDEFKSKKQYRIIILGGSTVEGQGALVPQENLPAQIQKYFSQKYPHLNIEVINAGVGGYESGQELLYLFTELVSYKPNLVIAYDGWNDCAYNNLTIKEFGKNWSEYKTNTHYSNEERLRQSYSITGSFSLFIEQIVAQSTVFFKELAFVHLISFVTEKASASLPKNTTQEQLYTYNPQSANLYAQRHAYMLMLAQWHNFQFASFIQPLMGVDNKKYTDTEKRYYEAVEKTEIPLRQAFYKEVRQKYDSLQNLYGKENSYLFADLSQTFSQTDTTVYADSGHLLLLGNSLVAKRMLEVLEKKQFLAKDTTITQ